MATNQIPTPPPSSTEKLIPFSIPNKVPIKLDLEKHNYNSWSSFSLIHLGSLGLKDHVEKDASSTNPEWLQLDDLIKMWILGSLSDSLQEQVVTTPGNAKALWDHLKSLFHDNKDARAISLDNELRSIKIGNMSVNEYCTKIKSMAIRLKNLECDVSEKNLVIYAVNGLDNRFANLVEIIRHREPLPPFETVRSMLLLKESSFKDETNNYFESSSSSPNVLLASHKGTQNKANNNTAFCNHFKKGMCRFGDKCRFIHDHRGHSGKNNQNNNHSRFANNKHSGPYLHSWMQTTPSSDLHTPRTAPQFSRPDYQIPQHPIRHTIMAQFPRPAHSMHPQAHLAAQAHYGTAHSSQAHLPLQPGYQGILGSSPSQYDSQATSLPNAFSTMTLQDPTWHMDTGFFDSQHPPQM